MESKTQPNPNPHIDVPLINHVTYNASMQLDQAFVEHFFLVAVGELHLSEVRGWTWETDASRIEEVVGFERLFSQTTNGSTSEVLGTAGARCLLKLGGGKAELVVASEGEAGAVLASLRNALPSPAHVEGTARMLFWAKAGFGGGIFESRHVGVHPWADVRLNYPVATQATLDQLMSFVPMSRGKLVLFHGPPGTGKTNALRALAWEWRSWCSFEYVLDPEELLTDVIYLREVAMRNSSRGEWRAVLLEDTGELLQADAKQHVGQGLSRLLNMSDGLPGQSMKTLFIITTNEDLGQLHPAVARSGRCATRVSFEAFSASEATGWFAAQGQARQVQSSISLAEMYATLNGGDLRPALRRVGFGTG